MAKSASCASPPAAPPPPPPSSTPTGSSTEHRWIPAGSLEPGDHLQSADGTVVEVSAVDQFTVLRARVHNLTVDTAHTYYAGTQPVLVHNCPDVGGVPKAPTGRGSVPKEGRDPQRLYTRPAVKEGLEKQGGACKQCGGPIDDVAEARGHHVQRHADGGETKRKNLAVLCKPCYKKVHRK